MRRIQHYFLNIFRAAFDMRECTFFVRYLLNKAQDSSKGEEHNKRQHPLEPSRKTIEKIPKDKRHCPRSLTIETYKNMTKKQKNKKTPQENV